MKSFFAFISRHASKIHFPYTRKKIEQEQIYKAISVLRPGDIILTHVNGELSNVALSHWSHVGVYQPGLIYEATTHGVVNTNIVYFLARKDDFKILRPTFNFDQIEMLTFLNGTLGDAYDFEFESNDQQYYCFELAAVAYMQSSNVVINPVKTLAGHQFLHKSFSSDLFIEIPI